MSYTTEEIISQPECWERAISDLPEHVAALPKPGESVAVIGCGTSLFMAQSYAWLREDAGHGLTDVYQASEAKLDRPYDRVLAMSRSGTTTEVLTALQRARKDTRITAITAVGDSPVADLADDVVCLPYADERSVVQTRFPTTQLVLLRAHLGQFTDDVVDDAKEALRIPLEEALRTAEQFSFLGEGWHVGVANEAALKVREAAAWWTESYSAMEYRHGPIAVAGPGRVVWSMSALDARLAEQIRATGGFLRQGRSDPLAELILVQRLAVWLAVAANRDPDSPPHLTRSIVLKAG